VAKRSVHHRISLCALALAAASCAGSASEDVVHPARAPVCAFAGPDAPRHMFAGGQSVCALVGVERELWCWGSSADGSLHFGGHQLGNCRSAEEQALYQRELDERRSYAAAHPGISCMLPGRSRYAPLPCALRPFKASLNLRDVSLGEVSCGVTPEGDARCWRLSSLLDLGRWPVDATELQGARRVVAAATGGAAYGLFPGGRVKCGATPEGASSDGLCGKKINPFSSLQSRVVQLESDTWSVCAVTEDRRLVCSGESPERTGCIGYCGRFVDELRKLRVRRVALGGERRCAQTIDDEVLCWGRRNPSDSTAAAAEWPERVPGLPKVATLAGGGGLACAIAHDGQVYCWGSLLVGEQSDVDHPQPTGEGRAERIEGLPPLCELAGGGRHMCGVAQNGSVYCWGANPSGQLGDGTREDHLLRAVQVLPPGSVVFNAPDAPPS
jgi:hypothetical protein